MKRLFTVLTLLLPGLALAQDTAQSCMDGPAPQECLKALPQDAPGLGRALMDLAGRMVAEGRFEAAAELYGRAESLEGEAGGLALWAQTAAGVPGLFPGARTRSAARRLLRRDSLDAGASLVIASQDVDEVWRRNRRVALPRGMTSEQFNTMYQLSGRDGQSGARFSDRYRGVELAASISSESSESKLYRRTESALLTAIGHPILGPYALRLASRLYLAARNTEAVSEVASRFRIALPDHYLGYLVGAMAAADEGRSEAAATLAQMGLDLMPPALRERVLDPRTVLSTAVEPPEDPATWWEDQDPIAMTLRNERLTEHVRRWTYAEVRFGNPYTGLLGADTTPGQVIVRYGIPLNEVQYTGDSAAGLQARAAPDAGMDRFAWFAYPSFSFRFMDMAKTGEWAFYSPHSRSYEGGRANSEVRSSDYVLLARERFRDTPTLIEPAWEVAPLHTALFRGQTDDILDVVVVGEVPFGMGRADNGALVIDEFGRVVSGGQVIAPWEEGEAFTTTFQIPVEDGRTRYSGRVEAVVPASLEGPERVLVFESASQTPPASRGLAVSSVLMADLVEEASPRGAPGGLVRKGLHILPSGDLHFPTTAPVYAYFEIYGLSGSGATDYRVTATMTPLKDGGASFLGRIFRGGDSSVGAGFRSSGSLADTGEYIILDPGSASEGEYLLRLTVEDLLARTSVETQTRVRFD